MEDKLRLNTKLYGFDGIIGRRDYFFNLICICAISTIVNLPYIIWSFAHMETFMDYFCFNKLFLSAPVLLKIWTILSIGGVCVLSVSNIFRRLNDINGEVKKEINITCSALCVLSAYGIVLPFPAIMSYLVFFINFIISCILLFKSGKITSAYPYDFRKEFNWGAFLGTWIWGLFNKSYIPLWIFILGFTPIGIYFQIYCGLKGNEWAFNNKKWTDVDKFNKSQEKQAIIFVVLNFLLLPIIYFAIVASIVGLLMFAGIQEEKTTPEGTKTTIEKLEDVMTKYANLYFEKHEITESENKYYVLNSDWNIYNFTDKKDILDMAASLAAEEREKVFKTKNPDKYESFSKTSELPRTKIYSSETGQLLGEFIIDKNALESGSFKDAIKAGLKAYRFYNVK